MVAGLDWQTIQLPFAAGLNTKAHDHALDPPALTTCKNVEFDEVGGLRLRKPYASIGANIYGGGTLSDVRKLFVYDDELAVFTKDTLYTWSETLTAWVNRGTHLAVKVDEATRFDNTTDQVFADRAQLGNLIVFVWSEVQPGGTALSYLAATDATTGGTVLAPTSFGANQSHPRVVATATRIMVLWRDTSAAPSPLRLKVIDPAAPAFSPSGPTTVLADAERYDVVKDPAANQVVIAARNAAGTAYTVARVNVSLVITTSTKARTADGVIALSCAPAAADRVQILRTSGNNVVGDLLVVTTLADVATGQAVGTATTTINQLTGAHRSTTDQNA
jgi:hypothetical protein